MPKTPAEENTVIYDSFSLGALSKMTVPARHFIEGESIFIRKSDWHDGLGVVYEGLLQTERFGKNSAVERAYQKTQNGNLFAGRQINLLSYGTARAHNHRLIDGEPSYKLYAPGVWALLHFAQNLKSELGRMGTPAEKEYFNRFFDKVKTEPFSARLKDAFGRAAKKASELASKLPPAVKKLTKKFPKTGR